MIFNKLKILAFIIGLIFFELPALYSQNNIQEFSLESYIYVVKENNLKIKISKNNQATAALSVKEAMAALLPQVNIQGNFRRFFNEQFTYFEAPDYENIDPVTGEIPQIMQKFKMGFDNDLQVHALLQQSIFSLKSIYDLQASINYSKLGELEHKKQVQKILNEARKLFLQTVLMKKIYELNLHTESYTHKNYQQALSKYNHKLISELDLLQAKILWEDEIPNLLKSQRNYSILLGNLKIVAGISLQDSISIKHNLYESNKEFKQVNHENVLNDRLEYLMLETNCEVQEQLLKSKKAAFLPTLELQMGYSYYSSSDEWSFTKNKNKYTYGGLTINVPIFSSGFRRSQVNKAKISYDTAVQNSQLARNEMLLEIKNLQLKLAENIKSIEATRNSKETAEKAYKIMISNKEEGLISQLDLRKMSNDYKQAEINYYNSIYNFDCTLIDYNNAIANY